MNDVQKLGKKILTIVAVVSTILWAVGAPLLVKAETNVTLTAGDVIKGATTKNVFVYAADGKRYTFPTDKVYFSWFKDWSFVKTIPDAQLGAMTIGGTIAYRPGTQLIKIATDPKVYALEPNGSLRWIETGAIAQALWGANWGARVHDVDPTIFPYVYKISASSLNTATYPVGSLVRLGADYFLIGAGMTKMKVTPAGLTANRYDTKFAATATDLSAYATGADLTTLDTTLTTIVGTPAVVPPVVVGGNVTVALAADTPAAGSAALTAIRVPFTKVTLTSATDAVVKNLVVERQGIASDGAFSSIMLIDSADNSRIGLDQTLNSLHQMTFNDEITIKAGVPKTIMIAGNMTTTGHGGEMPKLALVGLTVNNSGTVAGLPVVGNAMTVITTLSLGTLTAAVGSNDPGQAVTNKALGTTGYIFSGIRLTAGSNEDMSVESIRFYQSGSAAATDLANVKVNFDGTDYPTVLSADGKYYTANFNGVTLNKGITKELYIKADVLSGSSRTVRFDIYRKTDLAVKGKSYGFYASTTGTSDTVSTAATATNGGIFSATNPWYIGYLVTMASGGNLRVDKGNLSSANVSKGSNDVVLGNFTFVVEGEAVKATQIVLNIDLTGTGSSSDVTNITLADATGVVAGPVDGADTGTTQDGTATFGTSVIIPTGTHTYTVKGNLNNDLVGGDTIRVGFNTPATKFTVTGYGTGNTVTATPATEVYSNYQTVKGGTLVVNVSPVPVAQTVVKGATDVVLANYTFDASGSGEDIKVTSFKPLLTVSGATYQNDISSVRVFGFDGTTDNVQLNNGSNVVSPASAAGTTDQSVITLDKPLYIPKGSSKTLVLKANISSAAQGTSVLYGITAASATYITAIGKDTTTAPTVSGSTITGQTMQLATSGQYSIALDSSRPQGSLLVSGSTGVTVNKLRFTGTTEPIAITKLRLMLTNYSASTSDQDVVKVYAYDDTGKLLSDGYFTGGVANLTIPTAVAGSYNPFIIAKDDEKVMTIKVDLATITTSASIARAGHSITVDYDLNTDTTLNQGIAQQSGVTVASFSADTDNTANVSYMFRSAPTVTKQAVSTTLLANGSGVALYRFKVAADPKGDVDLYKFTFEVSTTSGTTGTTNVSNLTLVDVTESSEVTLYASTVAPTVGAAYDVVLMASPGVPNGTATPRTVSAGTYRIFELRANVTGASTGSSVVSQLDGDAAIVSMPAASFMRTTTQVDADGSNDFIWSDKSASGHGTGTADWTNGFLVAGLPSSNLATEVLSK